MLTTILAIIILSILIFVHEFGHFLIARRTGVKVERFSLGFGPVLFKKKIGEGYFVISAVPLGGYVQMAGDVRTGYKGIS